METVRLGDVSPVTAPDGSMVLPLIEALAGSLVHCTLGPGQISSAVRHTVIEEIWYFSRGQGEMWRRDPRSGEERIDECRPGLCISIPEGVCFQFRNVGAEPLEFLCFTMPPWPGDQVASVVEGKWDPSL